MATVTIHLPDSLCEFLERQIAEGGHPSVEAFIQHLIHEDQKRKGRQKVEELLLEGLNSGEPLAATPEYWAEKDRRLREMFPEDGNE